MVASKSAVDWAVWRQLFHEGATDTVRSALAERIDDIVATYLEESAARLAALCEAIARREHVLGVRLTQGYKGLSAGIGARRLTELSHQLGDLLARPLDSEAERDQIDAQLQALCHEERRVQEDLKDWRRQILA